MADFTAKSIEEIEGAFGGAFKRVRASLGCTSFGMQVIEMPAGWDGYPNHDGGTFKAHPMTELGGPEELPNA